MRTFIIILCILAVLVGAVVVYLFATTPKDARPLRFPLDAAQAKLLAHVPPDAEAYALIPRPAVVLETLLTKPTTRDAVARVLEEHPLPPAPLLGRADAVVWKRGKTTSYAVDFVAAALGAKHLGASPRAMTGAALGTLLGLFLGLPGLILGPFVGAVLGELSVHRDLGRAGRAGVAAWIGFAIGTAVKVALAFSMVAIFLAAMFLF